MHELNFVEMLKISLVMPVLLVLSVLLLAVLMERWFFYLRMAGISAGRFKKIKTAVLEGNLDGAREIAGRGSGLIDQALEAILGASKSADPSAMDHVLSLYYQRIQSLLGRRLGFFGTVSFISPLLGLLGTVLGVMTAFRDIGATGASGPAVVAAGISEALISTAAGIAVAVTAAIIYNYFNFRLKHVLNSLNIFGQEIAMMIKSGQEI